MAVTITRTPWIDDDGTGTTGTVINNAVKTALYNDIDGALAKVAQLAGGNTFTGTQSITDLSSPSVMRFLTASVERMRILATGEVMINTTGIGTALFGVAADGNARTIRGVLNTNASNVGYLDVFLNSGGGLCGSINQTGATTVAYNTTSDARLKHDDGAATDLTALRAVVIHDFTWNADGRRDRGVFAQDAHALYPRAVVAGTDETTATGTLARPWMTDYSKFVPDLIVGWQQHDAELAELRALLTTEGL